MLAAGAMLTPGKVIRSRQLWAGRPAKYVHDLRDEELEAQREGVAGYVDLARRHLQRPPDEHEPVDRPREPI